jgi:hypothetical protein
VVLREEYEGRVIWCIEGGIVVQWCTLLVGVYAKATITFQGKIFESWGCNIHGGPVGMHGFNSSLEIGIALEQGYHLVKLLILNYKKALHLLYLSLY